MRLGIGDKLGPYEVLAPLGAGGMGEVYRARDSRLGRIVAIKVLPEAKSDPDRKRRFLEEAKAASAINHPHIAALYDISSDGDVEFLVMEYVDGVSLHQSIASGKVTPALALKYGIEIAGALASAHRIGIVHRDVKPGNIMISTGGAVKILDFGLAKLAPQPPAHNQSTQTLDHGAFQTMAGAIVGTAAYMSPEQGSGGIVDHRSDIFSFGVVLYEMLTGRQAFTGKSAMEILSAVLKEEPKPVRTIRPDVPVALDRVVRRCLRKDPARRFQCIDDARIELTDIAEGSAGDDPPAVTVAPLGRMALWLPLAAALLLAVAWFVFLRDRGGEPLSAVPLTSYPGSERYATFSPDGRQVAFSWDGEKQDNFDIYIKVIGSGAPLRITNDPAPDFFPAWSPDGRWIAFLRLKADNKALVMMAPALGGTERRVAEIEVYGQVSYVPSVDPPRIAWSPDAEQLAIVDREGPGRPFGLFSLAVDTGEKRRLTLPPEGFKDAGPAAAPDGSSLVFTRTSNNIGVGDLYLLPVSKDFQPAGEARRLTFDNAQNGHPAWTADGREVVFSSPRAGGTVALWRLKTGRQSEPQRVPSVGEDALFPAVSRQLNRMIYTKYAIDSNIWRVEAAEQLKADDGFSGVPLVASSRQDVMPQYSPDGRHVTFASDRTGFFEIWVCDADGANAVQLTSLKGVNFYPSWSPDGQRIAFQSTAGGPANLYLINAGGGKPRNLRQSGYWPRFSHDGQWIYFTSSRTGRPEIWRMPAQGGDATQFTHDGGFLPIESPDGKFLYFMHDAATGPLYRVPAVGGKETQVTGLIAARGYAVTDTGVYAFVPPKVAPATDYYEINRNHTLEFFALTGGSQVIAHVRRPLQLGITLSPDGKSLLYPQIDSLVEDLMLVENFR